MILTATPYRVSLFGGGTDYPEWFRENHGAVLGMAINKYCYVGVKRMPIGQDLRYRVQYSKVDDCMAVSEIKHPAVRGALQYFGVDTPLEFHCFGDFPGRAGLGSSSSFTVGLVHSIRTLLKLGNTDPWKLSDEAIFIEQDIIKEMVGCQDQILAAHGGLKYITFNNDGRTLRTLDLPTKRLTELESSFVLVYTGIMRDAHLMAAKQVAEIPSKYEVLCRLAQLADEGMEILLNHKPLNVIGEMLNEAWELKRALCSEVSSPDIDALYERGLSCGALGGKLLGAGGGGFMLFFVPPEHRQEFMAMIGSPCATFKVSHQGTRVVIG